MKKLWTGYTVFLSRGYRWAVFLICPILIAGFATLLYSPSMDETGMILRAVMLSYVTLYEIVSDYWLFGGICNREENGMEYLKSSKKGLAMIGYGIYGDLLRRFLYLFVYGVVYFGLTGQLYDLIVVLLVYSVAVLSLNISRHMVIWQFYLLVAGLGMIIFDVLFAVSWVIAELSGYASAILIGELIFSVCLSIMASVFTAWYTKFCVKRSYYEKGFDKGL